MLDTNVLSAMMSAASVPEVATWVSGQPAELLFTATVCQAKILSGLAIMPDGRRRLDLEAAARAMFAENFEGRVLAFDKDAAVAYADSAPRRLRNPVELKHYERTGNWRHLWATAHSAPIIGFAL